jgi:hypothetical protein
VQKKTAMKRYQGRLSSVWKGSFVSLLYLSTPKRLMPACRQGGEGGFRPAAQIALPLRHRPQRRQRAVLPAARQGVDRRPPEKNGLVVSSRLAFCLIGFEAGPVE